MALADYAVPGETLVRGALGSVGYYSNLFIYDQYGLVNREVAGLSSLETAALFHPGVPIDTLRPRQRSPGRDKAVPESFFLDREPAHISARIFEGKNQEEPVRAYLEEWRQSSQYAEICP